VSEFWLGTVLGSGVTSVFWALAGIVIRGIVIRRYLIGAEREAIGRALRW
jgi:hypothetical protein